LRLRARAVTFVPSMSELSELSTRAQRAHCYRCDKAALLCLCERIPRVLNRTPIVILQHKRESRHPLGTVRILDLGLENRRLEVVPAGARSGSERPSWLPDGAGLLYPSKDAAELGAIAVAERPRAIVAIDGTWNQARALFRDHAWLQTLPRFRLQPSSPSRYRIRREPLPAYRSTVEAVVQALDVLEPGCEAGKLLVAFDALIDDQIAQSRGAGRAPRKRDARPFRVRKMPLALVEGFDRLVVVYGEAARPEHEPDGATELVHWCALRVRDGAVFDEILRPTAALPSDVRLRHLGLTTQDVACGGSLAELTQRWSAFLKADDLIAAWNPRTLELFGRCLGHATNGVGLKGVYRRIRGVDGDLDRVLALEAASQVPALVQQALTTVRGRAQTRLSNALRIVYFLRELAFGD
jgi:DTW domain-containing protein YfiP